MSRLHDRELLHWSTVPIALRCGTAWVRDSGFIPDLLGREGDHCRGLGALGGGFYVEASSDENAQHHKLPRSDSWAFE
jgi:hypothetical protein